MSDTLAPETYDTSSGENLLKLFSKLMAIQCELDCLVSDGYNNSDKYRFPSHRMVIGVVRPLMNQHKLLLQPIVTGAKLHEGSSKSGTTRYLTELHITWRWIDSETGAFLDCPFYAQGVDLAGERGPNKALTYAEKEFLKKYFHLPTKDPDGEDRGTGGEKKQAGTQASKELAEYHRAAVQQMAHELCGGDPAKIMQTLVAFTANKARQVEGTADLSKLPALALAAVYGKMKTTYEQKTGKVFSFLSDVEGGGE